MNVEYTGRQYEVTPDIRKQIEHELKKLVRILGDNFESKVILAMEKRRCKAEIAVITRIPNPVVGLAEANDMSLAVGEALEHIERQVVKNRARWRNLKRQPRKHWHTESRKEDVDVLVRVGPNAAAAVPLVVHTFPTVARITETHVVRSDESVAMKPMTLEEAVKEAEFRDRDVFVFRDEKGKIKVLHRKKDGKMELIEAP